MSRTSTMGTARVPMAGHKGRKWSVQNAQNSMKLHIIIMYHLCTKMLIDKQQWTMRLLDSMVHVTSSWSSNGFLIIINAVLTFHSEMIAVRIGGYYPLKLKGVIFSETRVDARVSKIHAHNSEIVVVCIRSVNNWCDVEKTSIRDLGASYGAVSIWVPSIWVPPHDCSFREGSHSAWEFCALREVWVDVQFTRELSNRTYDLWLICGG